MSGIKKSKIKNPQTMEELMARYGGKIRVFRRGQPVEGRVTAITGRRIYFDIGGKTEGMVLGREFEACRDFIRTLKPNDKVKLIVAVPESDRGQTLLNLRQTVQDSARKYFQQKLEKGEEVMVKGRGLNKGGVVVSAPFGLQGFIPGSQLGGAWVNKHEKLINRFLKVKVIEVNQEENRLIFSERLVSEADKIAQEEALLKKIKIGRRYRGEIVQVLPYGLMVEIKVPEIRVPKASRVSRVSGVVGLVHISEVSWSRVEDLGKFYKEGDKIEVKAVDIGDALAAGQGGKLQLSIKQLQPDPWEGLASKYSADKPVKGTVKRLAAYGAIVEIGEGIEGLLHISKIPPDFQIDVGSRVNCLVESVDKENRRLALGLVLTKKPVGYK